MAQLDSYMLARLKDLKTRGYKIPFLMRRLTFGCLLIMTDECVLLHLGLVGPSITENWISSFVV